MVRKKRVSLFCVKLVVFFFFFFTVSVLCFSCYLFLRRHIPNEMPKCNFCVSRENTLNIICQIRLSFNRSNEWDLFSNTSNIQSSYPIDQQFSRSHWYVHLWEHISPLTVYCCPSSKTKLIVWFHSVLTDH